MEEEIQLDNDFFLLLNGLFVGIIIMCIFSFVHILKVII